MILLNTPHLLLYFLNIPIDGVFGSIIFGYIFGYNTSPSFQTIQVWLETVDIPALAKNILLDGLLGPVLVVCYLLFLLYT